MEFIWQLWKLGTDYSAIITAKGHWYFISYRKGPCKYIVMFAANDQLYSYTYWKGSNILQCLQQRTKYITIFTAKVQLYSNTYWKGPNIVQCLQQRTMQLFSNNYRKGPNILQCLQQRITYITMFKKKDQLFSNAYWKGPNILQCLQHILCNLIVY